jgi:hypothetical protein
MREGRIERADLVEIPVMPLSPAPTIRDSIDISAGSIFFRVRRVTSLNIRRQRRRPGQPCREEFREIGVVGLCALFRASRRGRARNHSGRSGPCRAPASAAWRAAEHPAMPQPTIATSARWWPASGLSPSGVPAPRCRWCGAGGHRRAGEGAWSGDCALFSGLPHRAPSRDRIGILSIWAAPLRSPRSSTAPSAGSCQFSIAAAHGSVSACLQNQDALST